MVYFAFLTDKIITKDALSKVSRHFYKEVKMNYRNFDFKLKDHFFSLLHFFESCPSTTVKTFFNFNMIILCETIATEQMKLAMCATNERAFVTQAGLDKFTNELLIANEINKVLFHNTFATFNAVRT